MRPSVCPNVHKLASEVRVARRTQARRRTGALSVGQIILNPPSEAASMMLTELLSSQRQWEALLVDAERILGTEHYGTLVTRHSLASAYHAVRRNDEAIAILQPQLADSKRLLSVEHPDTLTIRNSLASAYQDAGRIDDAIAIYELLRADCTRILGVEHSHTLATRNDLADAYRSAGRTADAERVEQQSWF
jgi:tetratricopeptide (TPR) repeat protein